MNKSKNWFYNNIGDKMKKEKEKQTIHCSVHNCYFCDEHINTCELNEIKVCNCGNNNEKEATMCNSYRKKEH